MEARSLVDKLLRYTQTHSQNPTTIDVLPFVQQSLQRLQPELGIAVSLDKLPVAPVKTRIDPINLAQLPRELLANAGRATRDRSKVRMRVHVMDPNRHLCSAYDQHVQGKMVALEFQDGGPGIEPDCINRVFQPFYTSALCTG